MDFDFIAASRGDAPAVGHVHQGFRYGLGLGADLGDLPGVATRLRYVCGASQKPRVDRQAASAFSVIVDVLRRCSLARCAASPQHPREEARRVRAALTCLPPAARQGPRPAHLRDRPLAGGRHGAPVRRGARAPRAAAQQAPSHAVHVCGAAHRGQALCRHQRRPAAQVRAARTAPGRRACRRGVQALATQRHALRLQALPRGQRDRHRPARAAHALDLAAAQPARRPGGPPGADHHRLSARGHLAPGRAHRPGARPRGPHGELPPGTDAAQTARRAQPPEPLPVDHTAAGRDREPPSITVPRALRFGLGKLAWGVVCCAALTPLRAACAALGREPPMWARAPRETVLRVVLRAPPPLWPISDHFVGAYCNMFWSPARER